MNLKNSVKIAVIAALLALICVSAHAAGNSSGYGWSENTGWSNFNPTGAGVTVYADHLEGYAWNENIGWIRLGTFTAGTAHTYANGASAADYGVNNNGSGVLSGYGWSENAGWIKFNPTGGGVTIDGSGNFSGYAWGENIGWINFANTTPAYKVVTSFTIGGGSTGSDIPGDLNGNGKVDLADAMIALKILDNIPVDNLNVKADVNGDGRIGHEEAIFVLQKVSMLRN